LFELLALVQSIFTVEWLTQHFMNNDFLVAGIFAGAAFMLRDIPRRVFTFINRQLTIEFTLTNEDLDYQDVVYYVEGKRFKWFSRTFTKSQKVNQYDEIQPEDETKLTIGYGKSWFYSDGAIGYIVRSFKDNQHSNKLKEEIFVKLFTRSPSKLQRLIDSATYHKKLQNDTLKVCVPTAQGYWSDYSRTAKRSFDSIFIDDEIKNQIINTLEHFINSREWYAEKGIPYKLGIFIEGSPGTGKSSVVRAICSYINRTMYFMTEVGLKETNLNNLISEFFICNNGMLVLEEIDTFSSMSTRKTKDDKDKTDSMSVILNILDGALTPENFIFVATTNHPEKIDPAIKRPGRFDLVIKIDTLSYNSFSKMMSKLFEVDENIIDKDFKTIYKPITGAKVQGTFILDRSYETAKNTIISFMKEE
jgi:mitochondrial chaperone BCS1